MNLELSAEQEQLAEGLRGLGRAQEAAEAQALFDAAWADSDTVIPGSCFCRTKA